MSRNRKPSIHDSRYQAIIKELVIARKEAKLSQSIIADALRLSQPDISKIERFERRMDMIEFFDYLDIIKKTNKNVVRKLWKKVNSYFG